MRASSPQVIPREFGQVNWLSFARTKRRLRHTILEVSAWPAAGKQMFSATDKDKQMLALRESESYRNGIQKLVYDVVR